MPDNLYGLQIDKHLLVKNALNSQSIPFDEQPGDIPRYLNDQFGGLFQVDKISGNESSIKFTISDSMSAEILSVMDGFSFTLTDTEKNNSLSPKTVAGIFENLFEITDKKSSGIYYTPYSIAEYMCADALSYWLSDKIPSITIEDFSSFFYETSKIKSKNDYKNINLNKIPDIIIKNAKKIDYNLNNCRILDPSCGAGEFLQKTLILITSARIFLSYILSNQLTEKELAVICMENSIYGVDIDPISVYLSRFRLWAYLFSIEGGIEPIRENSRNIRELDFLLSDDILGGKPFDIVIGNPPYIGQKGNKGIFSKLRSNNQWADFYERKQDIYYYFIAKGIEVLSDNGYLIYIIPPYFLTASAGLKLRSFLAEKSVIVKITELSETGKVFRKANINNIIITLKKHHAVISDKHNAQLKITYLDKEPDKPESGRLIESNFRFVPVNFKEQSRHLIDIIDTPKINLDNTIPLNTIAKISPGIQTGCDKINANLIREYNLTPEFNKNDGVFVITDDEKNRIGFNDTELEFIKPFYKNSDISKWVCGKKNTKWVIISNKIEDLNLYPNIKKHLLKFKFILDQRYRNFALIKAYNKKRWWYLYGFRPKTCFDGAKIINPIRCAVNKFAYSDKPFYSAMDIFYTIIKDSGFDIKYVLAILNSSFALEWLKCNCVKKGGLFELISSPLGKIPIKKIPLSSQKPFIDIVDEIINLNENKTDAENSQSDNKMKILEDKLSDMVCNLYQIKIT